MEELSLPKSLTRTEDGVMLGVFQPSQFGSQFVTSAPGLSEATYAVNRAVVKLADEIGMSFSLNVSRWKSVRGDSVGYNAYGWDTYTLVAALLEATERITILSTTHTGLWNPVIAAKMGAGLDQIGRGRWGVNIVAGWNEAEFRSMGVPFLDHEKRYAQATEWLTAVRELWAEGESSFQGEFIKLDKAECHPRPMQSGGPVVVNAGVSPTGMRFAVDHADFMFSAFPNVQQYRLLREELHSDAGYIGMKPIVIGKTDADAEDRANEIVAHADLLAMATGPHAMLIPPDGKQHTAAENRARLAGDPALVRQLQLGLAFVGSPETLASKLAHWAVDYSVDGICMAFFDFERDLELFADRAIEPLGNTLASLGKSLVLRGK